MVLLPVLLRVRAQQADQSGRLGALREQAHRVRGEVGRGERGRVPVGERGLQLGGARALFVTEPGTRPTGATRMLAPQPLEWIWLASCQGSRSFSRAQAGRQVFPGARLFSGDWYQSTNSSRSGRSRRLGPSTPRSIAVRRPLPSASVICVSSLTIAGVGSSISRQGPHLARIDGTSLNSVGKPSASPRARPTSVPVAARLVTIVVMRGRPSGDGRRRGGCRAVAGPAR